MKLAAEDIKKIFLTLLLLIGLLYAYFNLLLGPLKTDEAATTAEIDALTPKISAARVQLKKTQSLEAQAPQATQMLDQIRGLIPEGAPVAWFPPRLTDFFKRQGIDRVATRMNNEFPEPEIPGFRRIFWAADLPKVDFIPLAIAIAALENEEPLIEITNLQVDGSKDDPQFQRAVLTISNIAKQ
jgi:hypothetical protein